MGATRATPFDALALCAIKLAVGAWVLWSGFTHISDDDYSRSVIAEQFAHAPRLDPSATSWLPLPFWIEGLAMIIAGRSLAVARAVGMVLGVASVGAMWAAMRTTHVSRAATLIAVIVGLILPWNAWLGVATVPEGWAGTLVASAALAMPDRRARPWAAAALLAASLSRYEAWPACALMAMLSLWSAQAARGVDRRRAIACAVIAAAGPMAWMAWNVHAHGSAFHFLARVSAFRHAMGAADVPLRFKLLGYPFALVWETPEVAALGIAGALGMMASPPLRKRWGWPAGVAAAIVAFLIAGDVGDGAPTHHVARALVAVWWILIGAGVDAVVAFITHLAARGARRLVVGCAAGIVGLPGLVWCATLPRRWDESPGRSPSELRDSQIARGLDMRARGVARAEIAPCSFEHFALIAAWGQPENATVLARTGEPPTPDCPRVVEK